MSGTVQGPDVGYILVPQIISESDSSEEDITKFVKEHGFHIISSKERSNKTTDSTPNKLAQKLISNAKKTKMNKQLEIMFKKPMSMSRKFAFVISILMCFIIVAVFLWVVPCEWSACKCKKKDEANTAWSLSATGIELEGPMSLTTDKLLFMMRSSIFEKRQVSLRSGQLPTTGGGLVAIDSLKPKEMWRKTLNNVPKEVDCNLIDANLDGSLDCIVITHNGFLAVLSQVTGYLLWRKPSIFKDFNMEFPLIVNDLNGDGVNDLVLISYVGTQKYQISILSGSSGSQLGQPVIKDDCDKMTGLNLTRIDTLIYVCVQGDRERIASLSILDLYKSTKLSDTSKLPRQHKPIIKSNVLSTDKYHVIIENTGACPDDCVATVNISDDTNHTVYSFNAENTYVMQPLIIHLNHVAYSNANGFLFKYWQWQPEKEEQEDFYDKDKIIIIRHLQEHIVLVMFNPDGTPGPHIVNASQSDIIQLCHSNSNSCQPNLAFQEYSILLADLDKDGYQDLITYLVTYTGSEKSSDVQTWSLVSQIRVIRLEHELPKLYKFLQETNKTN